MVNYPKTPGQNNFFLDLQNGDAYFVSQIRICLLSQDFNSIVIISILKTS